MRFDKSSLALLSIFSLWDFAVAIPNPIPQANPDPSAVPQAPSGPPITVSDDGGDKALTDCITSSNILSLNIGLTYTAAFTLTAGSWWVTWHEQVNDPVEQ